MSRSVVFSSVFFACFIATLSHASACAPKSALELKAADNAALKAYADFELEAISKPFGIDLYFCSEQNIQIERIKVDATMPAHQHGMNYTPEITSMENGNFFISGMFFHMPGLWQLEISVYQVSNAVAPPMLFTLDIKAQ
ncbi:MAG: hypothetical protein ABJO86_06460 [Lentilitoribacter sp.]